MEKYAIQSLMFNGSRGKWPILKLGGEGKGQPQKKLADIATLHDTEGWETKSSDYFHFPHLVK